MVRLFPGGFICRILFGCQIFTAPLLDCGDSGGCYGGVDSGVSVARLGLVLVGIGTCLCAGPGVGCLGQAEGGAAVSMSVFGICG